jgi:CBS-domain-containing membrane protein
MTMRSTVKDVMTTHVAAVRKTATYKDMAAVLREQRVSAFPVIDDDHRVIGVVSESDLLVKRHRARGHRAAPAPRAGQGERS